MRVSVIGTMLGEATPPNKILQGSKDSLLSPGNLCCLIFLTLTKNPWCLWLKTLDTAFPRQWGWNCIRFGALHPTLSFSNILIGFDLQISTVMQCPRCYLLCNKSIVLLDWNRPQIISDTFYWKARNHNYILRLHRHHWGSEMVQGQVLCSLNAASLLKSKSILSIVTVSQFSTVLWQYRCMYPPSASK